MEEFDKAAFTRSVDENSNDDNPNRVNKATREAIFDLLSFAEANALKVVGGDGNRSFHYVIGTRSGSAKLFYCYSYGAVGIALGNFPELSTREVSTFLRKLQDLSPQGFRFVLRQQFHRSYGGMQLFQIKETLVDPTVMKGFKDGVLYLQRKVEP